MAAPSIIQSKLAYNGAAGASLNLSFDTTPGVGRLIVVFAYAGGSISSVADNQGNTYTERATDGYGLIHGRLHTAPAAASAGTFTITVTPGANQFLLVVAYEVANWNSSPVYEKVGTQWSTSQSDPWSPLNFTATTNAEQLFLAAMATGNTGNNRQYDPGTGWTLDQQVATGTNIKVGAIHREVTSTGTYDPEFVNGSASGGQTLVMGISLVGGTNGAPGGGDEEDALGGSASTSAAGTAAPGIEIGL